jgi:hypothetical protein
MPVVRNLVRRISWSVGRYSFEKRRSTSEKKLGLISMEQQMKGRLDVLAEIVVESILVAFQDGKLHAFVCPEAVECCQAFLGHRVFHADFWICLD